MPEIPKLGHVTSISLEYALGDKFPRRAIVTEIPLTDADRDGYEDYVRRFEETQAAWRAVLDEGIHKSWAHDGMADEEPGLYELKPQHDIEYTETHEEWIARLARIQEHRLATGEWLEQPEPTFWDRFNQYVTDSLSGNDRQEES